MVLRKTRRKKSPRRKCEQSLDKLWRSAGKENAVCEVCATLPPNERSNYRKLDAHHIIGRGNRLLRWDLANRCFLCSTHHTFGNPCAEKNQGGWFLNWFSNEDWMGANRSEDKEYLREKKKVTYKRWTMDELRELKKGLEAVRDNETPDEYEQEILANFG